MNSLPPHTTVLVAHHLVDQRVRDAEDRRRAYALQHAPRADAAPRPWWRRFLPAGRPLPGASLPPAAVASG